MNMKEKLAAFAVKHDLPGKAKKLERTVCAGAAAAAAMGMTAVTTFAADPGMVISAETAVSKISEGVSPFTEPAVIIICTVSGIKLGQKLLKSAAR